MRIANAALVVLFATGMMMNTGKSRAEGCVLSGPVLDCSDGGKATKPGQIAAAFASPVTRANLAEPRNELGRFGHPADREKFRKSFEFAWAAANKFDKSSRRDLKRGRIDAATYEQRSAMHNDALESYRSAFWFYKTLIWQTRNAE